MTTIANLLLALLVLFLLVLAVRAHIETRNPKPIPLRLGAAHRGHRNHNGS